MRIGLQRIVAAAGFLGAAAVASPASADELVRFPAAGRGEPIQGFLTKPRGAGPFPAVVLLHSCLGLPRERAALGARVAGWGYAALFVDDFATRGLKETCSVDFSLALPDAYGALAYLASLPEVDPARVAAVGFSQGGDTALKIAVGERTPPSGARAFRAAAAFYPPCANVDRAKLLIPTLILVGGRDTVTPAADCAQLVEAQALGMVRFFVLPGAAHGFDLPEFGSGRQVLGMLLAYDRAAAARSWAELRDFLAAKLGR